MSGEILECFRGERDKIEGRLKRVWQKEGRLGR